MQARAIAVKMLFKQRRGAKTFDECVSKHGFLKLFSYFQRVKRRMCSENFRWVR
jgi:hypothetical protein